MKNRKNDKQIKTINTELKTTRMNNKEQTKDSQKDITKQKYSEIQTERHKQDRQQSIPK